MASAVRGKPSYAAAVLTASLFALVYGGGHFVLAPAASLHVPGSMIETKEAEEEMRRVARRYVSFPISITVNVPQWGTLLIDIGMAVSQDLHKKSTDNLLEDAHKFTDPLSRALLMAVEDPAVQDMEQLQKALPPLMIDALNGVFGTEDLPAPVLEVYILKLISTG